MTTLRTPCWHEVTRNVVVGRWTNDSNIPVNANVVGRPTLITWTVRTLSEAVAAAQEVEPGVRCYEVARDSGALSFWDEPEEDVYGTDDGEPV